MHIRFMGVTKEYFNFFDLQHGISSLSVQIFGIFDIIIIDSYLTPNRLVIEFIRVIDKNNIVLHLFFYYLTF